MGAKPVQTTSLVGWEEGPEANYAVHQYESTLLGSQIYSQTFSMYESG